MKNIMGKIGTWLMNFITDRSHKVRANGVLSYKSTVKSGVPQGTIIGPLLFLIMIDDISEVDMESIINTFGDDSKLVTKLIPLKTVRSCKKASIKS